MNSSDQPRDIEEVMRFDPEEAIVDLDSHLDRITEAAEAQGYRFDRHAARNELQAATFGRRTPGRVRLLLSPTGAMAIEIRALS
jgi:para-aminobenzoate synthetase/4-amino-4-deoxychorismate lyase